MTTNTEETLKTYKITVYDCATNKIAKTMKLRFWDDYAADGFCDNQDDEDYVYYYDLIA